jgi:hypothetical protein
LILGPLVGYGVGFTEAVGQNPVYLPGIVSTGATRPPGTPGGSAPVAPNIENPDYREDFDGQPSSPQAWRPDDWDVTVQSRDVGTFRQLDEMHQGHGADCGAPPATHVNTSYEGSVIICRDHMMTAIRGDDYAAIYLTPDKLVNFSGGEAIVRFDLSTLRGSDRDWVDIWISPYENHLQLPLDVGVDLNGEPSRAIHLRMDTPGNGSRKTFWRGAVIRSDFQRQALPQKSDRTYDDFLVPDAKRRDTYELRISRTHIKFGMPAYNHWWIDTPIADLGWDTGVVQLGHHSYNPFKCTGPLCGGNQPNTWHWDNVIITPAQSLTIIRATNRIYGSDFGGTTATFPRPAPVGAHLRFSGFGESIQVSYNGGASWQQAQRQRSSMFIDSHYQSYWMPIPEGTTQVMFRGTNYTNHPWNARDVSIFAR